MENKTVLSMENKSKSEDELSKIAEAMLREHGLEGIAGGIIVKRRLLGDAAAKCVTPATGDSYIVLDAMIVDQHPNEIEPMLAHELAHLLTRRNKGDHTHTDPMFLDYLTLLGGDLYCYSQKNPTYEELYPLRQKSVDRVSTSKNKNVFGVNKELRRLWELVRAVAIGETKHLIVISDKGLGKSTTVRETLNDEGLDFEILNGHETPFNFYFRLYKLNEKVLKREVDDRFIVVLDDTSGLLDNTSQRSGLALLKACLWNEDGKRIISYDNQRQCKEYAVPTEFLLSENIRFIMLMNSAAKRNKDVQAILSRCYVHEMNPTFSEKIATAKKIVENDSRLNSEEKLELIQCIEKNSSVHPEMFDFRICKKGADLIIDYRSGIISDWKECVARQLWVA